MSDEIVTEEPYVGYKSPEARRKFLRVGCALGMACLLANALLTTWLAGVFPTPAEAGWGLRFYDIAAESVVRWQGDLWCTGGEMTSGLEDPATTHNNRLIRLTAAGPQVVCSLSPGLAWLAPQEDALWIVSGDGLSQYDGKNVRHVPAAKLTGPTSRPFFLDGRLALLQEREGARLVMTLENNEWREVARLHLPDPSVSLLPDRLQVVMAGDKPVVFYQNDKSVYSHDGFPDETAAFPSGWQLVGAADRAWSAANTAEGPVVALLQSQKGGENSEIALFRQEPLDWKKGLATAFVYPLMTLGITQAASGSAAEVLYQAFPWSVNLLRVSGERLESKQRFGEPPPLRTVGRPLVPQGALALLTIALALALASAMRRMRSGISALGGVPVPLASLTRRGIALFVDGVIIFGPALVAAAFTLFTCGYVEDRGGRNDLVVAEGIFVAGLLWALLAFLLYCFCQGRWGRTPGKWAAGIRVLGTDLRPCGFGRSLIRTLLLVADQVLEFLFGVMLIAFTQNQQRLGDLLARTIVIRDRPLPVNLELIQPDKALR